MRKGLSLVIVLMLVFSVSAVVFARPGQGGGQIVTSQPDFDATIDITGELEVQVGVSTILRATWSTNNQDVNREEWSVLDKDQADVEMEGTGTVHIEGASEGESTFVFNAAELEPGNYQVCFRIWHHQQTQRDATERVTITVIVADDEEECPAAPAIANAYLNSLGITGLIRGEVIKAVTKEMTPGNDFQGQPKCNNGGPNPAYKEAVETFLREYLDNDNK